MPSTLIQRMRAYVAASDLTGNGNSRICCDVKEAADQIEQLTRELAGERDQRDRLALALRVKDEAMGELFDRLAKAKVDCSDLSPNDCQRTPVNLTAAQKRVLTHIADGQSVRGQYENKIADRLEDRGLIGAGRCMVPPGGGKILTRFRLTDAGRKTVEVLKSKSE